MTIISLWLQRRVCCDLQFELTLCSLFLIILDFDARRLIKRQKLTHPLHEARAPLVATPVGVASQHVSKAGRRQLDESLPPRRNRRGDDKRRPAIDATTSGNASFWCFFTSIIQENAARKTKQTPPLHNVHDGVQMRFTMGQIPVKCSNSPAVIKATAAIANLRNGIFGADS